MSNRIDIAITNNPKEDATMAGIANITDLVDGQFSWNIDAQGGFTTAQLRMMTDEVTAFQFLNDYIGKRIVFTNQLAPWASTIVWEGQIYTVGVDDGKTTVSRSMENVYNSVRVQYAGRDGTALKGDIRTTAAVTNTSSIAAYGTRQVLWQVGAHASNGEADNLRNIILNEYALPKANMTASRFGGGVRGADIVVSIDCIGFVEQLTKRLPEKTNPPGAPFVTHDNIIKWILTNYSDFISTDYSSIASNTSSEWDGFKGKLTARAIIDALCAKGFGGGSGYAAYFGVKEDRKAYYFDTPTTVGYIVRKYDSGENIVDATTGEIVPPWLVRPGKIVKVADLLPDSINYGSLFGDPRNMFIAGVRFLAPNRVQLMPGTYFPGSTRIAALLGSTVLGYNYWGYSQ